MTSERAAKFVAEMNQIADDPAHGYSQKPPSGRWGPDYDCSSVVYEAANAAGYPVGRSNDEGRVRFTGTMLEDFKKAGFQILPFANVGLGELEVGDILLNLALHAEVYVGEGQVVGAEASETGGYSGEEGDQTGLEITRQPVYEYDKGWDYVLRPPSDEDDEEDTGGQEMPSYPYPNNYPNMMGNQWPGSQRTNPMPQMWGNSNQGYPQGGLAQMNGYSQANSGYGSYQQPQGYSQGGQGKQLNWVNGMEGARDHHLAPNSCDVMFDQQDPSIMYVKSTDQQGFPSIRVFRTSEISEDMPQHHMGGYGQEMPGMQQGQYVSRQEFEELREMISNVQSAINGSMGPQGNADGSGQQGNSQNRSGSQQSQRGNGRNS